MGGTCTNDNDTNRHDYLQSVTFQWLSCVAPPSTGVTGVVPVAVLVMVKLAGDGVLVALVVSLLSLEHVVESECIGGRHPSASDLVSE